MSAELIHQDFRQADGSGSASEAAMVSSGARCRAPVINPGQVARGGWSSHDARQRREAWLGRPRPARAPPTLARPGRGTVRSPATWAWGHTGDAAGRGDVEPRSVADHREPRTVDRAPPRVEGSAAAPHAGTVP